MQSLNDSKLTTVPDTMIWYSFGKCVVDLCSLVSMYLVDANSIVTAHESQDHCCMFPNYLLTYIDIVLCCNALLKPQYKLSPHPRLLTGRSDCHKNDREFEATTLQLPFTQVRKSLQILEELVDIFSKDTTVKC